MVTVELIGGLGNQMFQIAACIAYAKRHGMDFHIPLETKNSHHTEPYFTKLTNPAWDDTLPLIAYNELAFSYNEIPIIDSEGDKEYNIILKGYFQSYKYFDDYYEDVVKALETTIQPFKADAGNFTEIAIHVRRGDYLQYPDKHPVITEEYLKNAISRFTPGTRFTFFSDDLDWCNDFADNYLKVKNDGTLFTYFMNEDPIKAISELRQYGHRIISNSTFSWWAAYLNKNQKKFVFYPSFWFGPAYSMNDTKDLCPPEWIKL